LLSVVLHPGRERSVQRRHPWLLSGAIARVEGEGKAGDQTRVVSHDGAVLGYGHYSPASQIRVRLLSFGKDPPAETLVAERIQRAIDRRRTNALLDDTDALRLVNAEGDELPGLVVDRFASVLAIKTTSAGMYVRRQAIAGVLKEATGATAAVLREDESLAKHEGIEAESGPLWGEAPAEVWIEERGRRYAVDVSLGQKTGFYLDQRDARDLVERLARGRTVLDLYAHTGGFAVAAIRGGAASVKLVESSKDALDLARRNLSAASESIPAELVQGDVHRFLRDERASYDLIVVDPPPLARSKKDVDRASRAYKDGLLYALHRARPGAFVLAFSCSHYVGADLFRKIVFGASLDARRSLQVLRELGQPADHPSSIDHPEGQYLSGFLLRATS
jgi:23S rRNA (cytosine1962-C5)-methyltransferase